MTNSFKFEDYSGVKIKEAFALMPELYQRFLRGEITSVEVRVVYKAIRKEFFRQKGIKYDK